MFPIQTTVVSQQFPIVTWVLIAINAVLFYYEATLPPDALKQFTYLFGVVPARYTHPEWTAWVGFPVDKYIPYLTSLFLHGGLAHLVGNMWTLWIFGQHVEDRMGPARFLTFYLFCGIAAGTIHTIVNFNSTIPAIGASGAIAGVMAAYLALFPMSRVIVLVPIFIFPFFFDFLAFFYLGYWFLLQLFSGSVALVTMPEAGGIAFWAHVGGFVFGLFIVTMFLPAKASRSRVYRDQGTYEHGFHFNRQ